MTQIKLHSDSFDRNGKVYDIKGYSRREGSTMITFDVIVNPFTTHSMTVPESEVEWLDEV